MSNKIAVRDRRKSTYFWSDKSVLASNLTPNTKLVYFCLCSFADEKSQECYPALDTIAQRAGISRRQVIDSLKSLENEKLIAIDKNVGRNNTNVYTLLSVNSAISARVQKTAINGAKNSTKIVHSVHPNKHIEHTQENETSSEHINALRAVKDIKPFQGNYADIARKVVGHG